MTAEKSDTGTSRRTSYSKDISAEFNNKEVTLVGWIVSIRKQGGIFFIMFFH